MTLDEALEKVTVHDSDDVNAALMESEGEGFFTPYPENHWLVSDDRTGGIHACFSSEDDAHAWRMYLVSELLRITPIIKSIANGK